MKRIIIKNPNHPVNMRDAHGQRAKEAARKLSNKELDELLEKNLNCIMDDKPEQIKAVLAWTRSEKIKFIVQVSKRNFVKQWNESNPVLEEKTKETK